MLRPEVHPTPVVDVKELTESHRALTELVRSKDEFVAAVSHELRTPLTAVHGFAAELHERWDEFSEGEARELLALIVDQSAEVADLLEDLLVSARADIGQLVVVTEVVDLESEVRRLLESSPRRVTSRIRSLTGSAGALADPMRLRQIIRNLLTNAERYGGDDIRIELGSSNGIAVLTVRDNGSGISTEDREKVFEPYEQANPQPAGVGLGLTVSRRLARLMDGDLSYSYSEGWSTFQLTLPDPQYHATSGPRRPEA